MMNVNNTVDIAYGWEDTIIADPVEWTPLPEGEYDFEVINFKRAQYQPKPGAKMPPCNMANLEIMLHGPTGTRKIQHSLFLHSKTEGLLSAFFTSIGQKKKGEPLRMNWPAVVGSKGRAKVIIDKYTSTRGEELLSNKITRFLEPETAPAPQQGQQTGSWQDGGQGF